MLVVPDALTLRYVSDALDGHTVQPTYKLVTKSGDLVLDADGIPLRYALLQRRAGATAERTSKG